MPMKHTIRLAAHTGLGDVGCDGHFLGTECGAAFTHASNELDALAALLPQREGASLANGGVISSPSVLCYDTLHGRCHADVAPPPWSLKARFQCSA